MKNLIHRLNLDLSFPSDSEDLLHINKTIESEFKDKIIRILDEEIEANDTEFNIFIDKIEIDLEPNFSSEDLLHEFRTQFRTILKNKIQTQSWKIENANILNNTIDYKHQMPEVWTYENFIYFLQTGLFKYQIQHEAINHKETLNLIKIYIESNIHNLQKIFIEYPISFKRFLMEFRPISKYFFEACLANFLYFKTDVQIISLKIQELSDNQILQINSLLIKSLFQSISNSSSPAEAKYIFWSLKILNPKESCFLDKLTFESKTLKSTLNSSITETSKKLKKNYFINNTIEKIVNISKSNHFAFSKQFIHFLENELLVNESEPAIANYEIEKEEILNENYPNIENSIFTNQAGLILLHPFIEQLFFECNLINGKAFKNTDSQSIAIQLLQYLATFDSKLNIGNIVIHKILCGLHPFDNVHFKRKLSNIQKDLCKDLLKQAIIYWDILKNTSSEALQLDFIQRSGTISIENNKYILEMERKSIDILLDRIPWPTSIIKLPWMQKILMVNWQ